MLLKCKRNKRQTERRMQIREPKIKLPKQRNLTMKIPKREKNKQKT